VGCEAGCAYQACRIRWQVGYSFVVAMSKYDKLVKSLSAKGSDDPKALAAYIGRKKLGKEEFQRRAAAGRRAA